MHCRVGVVAGDRGHLELGIGKHTRVSGLWICAAEHEVSKKILGMWNEESGFALCFGIVGTHSREVYAVLRLFNGDPGSRYVAYALSTKGSFLDVISHIHELKCWFRG